MEGLRALAPTSRAAALAAIVNAGERDFALQVLSASPADSRAAELHRIHEIDEESARPLLIHFADRPELVRLCSHGTEDPALVSPLLVALFDRTLRGSVADWRAALEGVEARVLRAALPTQPTTRPLVSAVISLVADAPDLISTLRELPPWSRALILEEAALRHPQRLLEDPVALLRFALEEPDSGAPSSLLSIAVEAAPPSTLLSLGPPPSGRGT